MNGNIHSAKIVLRWGLAFVFFYAAVFGLVRPDDWIGYFPGFLQQIFPPKLLLAVFSLYEIILAAWFFWGRKPAGAALFAILTLAGVVVSNTGAMDIVFRDVGLALAALALYHLSREKSHSEEEKVGP